MGLTTYVIQILIVQKSYVSIVSLTHSFFVRKSLHFLLFSLHYRLFIVKFKKIIHRFNQNTCVK